MGKAAWKSQQRLRKGIPEANGGVWEGWASMMHLLAALWYTAQPLPLIPRMRLMYETKVLQVAFIVLAVLLIDIGTGRHLQYIEYVMTTSQTKKSEVLDFSAHLIYTTALFSSRLSGLAFYHRLCELYNLLFLAVKCALVLLIAAYLPQTCLIIFHCNPVTGLWPYSWQLGSMDYVCLD